MSRRFSYVLSFLMVSWGMFGMISQADAELLKYNGVYQIARPLPKPTKMYMFQTAPKKKKNWELKSPVLGGLLSVDLDRDGKPEVLAATSEKGLFVRGEKMEWVFKARMGRSIPAVADLDGDEKLEIVLASCTAESGKRTCSLHILSHDGKEKKKVEIPGEIRGTVVLQDLDGDKAKEIVFSTQNGFLVVLDRDGHMRKNFPKKLGKMLPITESIYVPSPTVGELDGRVGNGREILAVSTLGEVHAFHADGTSLPAFPIQLKEPVFASPTMGDFDGDGLGEMLIVTSKGKVHLFKPNAEEKEGFPFQVRGQVVATPAWADLNRDGKLDLFIGTQAGLVYGLTTQGKLLAGWPRKVHGAVTASLLTADITSDSKKELVVVTQAGSIYAFKKWGHTAIGYPVKTGEIVYATPTITDLDNDGRADILMPTHSNRVFVFEDLRQGDATRFQSGVSFRGGLRNTGSLNNVSRTSSLMPRSIPKPGTGKPGTGKPGTGKPPTEPGNPTPPGPKGPGNGNVSGCNLMGTTSGSLSSLLLLGLVLLVTRRKFRVS